MAKRKISFNYLYLKDGDLEQSIEEPLVKLLSYILSTDNIHRKQDVNSDKFAFLDSIEYNNGIDNTIKLLFKSAKHSYRAPLLDKNTVESRENPKKMSEGEQMKTHLLIKFKEGNAIVFLESGNNMLTCTHIVTYLNHALFLYNSQLEENSQERIVGRFTFAMIPRDDFEDVLRDMDRVICAEVFVDKSILGTDILNFSNPSEQIQQNLVLTVKAERKKSIKEHIYDLIDKLNGAQSQIRRIRVVGKSANGNSNIIDTDFIIKKEFIEVQQDSDTGEYNTADMFCQLITLSNDY